MKTTFTNDEFKKLIEAEIYVAFIYGAAFDCDTMYEDNEGRSCLAFIIEDDDEYIFPWDDIKEIIFFVRLLSLWKTAVIKMRFDC